MIERVLEPRQNVKIWKSANDVVNAIVDAVQPFGEVRKDLLSGTSLSSESTGSVVEVSEAYVNEGMFAQIYVEPIDDIGVQIAPIGQKNELGQLKNVAPPYTKTEIEAYGRLPYFIQLENTKLYMYPYNPTKDTITTAKIRMIGYLYTFTEVPQEEADSWTVWRDEFIYTLR